jgi:hypothetical protein
MRSSVPGAVATGRAYCKRKPGRYRVRTSQLIEHFFIDIAPAPIFAGLKRFNDRVLRGVKVFGCVLIFRRVAAAYVAARHTQTQMNPGVADLQTVFTAVGARRDFANLIEVCAVHSFSNNLSTDFADFTD